MKVFAWILIFASMFTFGLATYKLYESFSHPLKFNEEIACYSKEYEIPAELIASVINVESSFNVNAKSNKNAIGLMQVKLSTANYLNDLSKQKYITEDALFYPTTNIKYGTLYLRYLINKFNDANTALAAYNAGETIVRSWLKNKDYSSDEKSLQIIPYKETRNYVEKVNKNIKYYKKIFS